MNNHGDIEVVGILTHVPSRSLSWTTFKSTRLNASNYEDFHKCHVSLKPKSTQRNNWKFVKWNNEWFQVICCKLQIIIVPNLKFMWVSLIVEHSKKCVIDINIFMCILQRDKSIGNEHLKNSLLCTWNWSLIIIKTIPNIFFTTLLTYFGHITC